MEDLKYSGNHFSWVAKRRKEVVQCCLDRVLVNSEWRQQFPASETLFLDLAESDHRPLIVSIEYTVNLRKGLFKYDKRLVSQDDFVETVTTNWEMRSRTRANLSTKLIFCRRVMANWKRIHKLNAAERVESMRTKIDNALQDPTVSSEEIGLMRKELNQAY